jgi:hypothetical protein
MGNIMSSSRQRCLYLALSLTVAAGCRSGGASAQSEGRPTTTTIDIQNEDFNDMTVYVLVNGQRTRLGIAYGNKTTVLTIAPYLINGTSYLRFVANPLAGNRTPVSEEIDVSTGDQLVMVINPGG